VCPIRFQQEIQRTDKRGMNRKQRYFDAVWRGDVAAVERLLQAEPGLVHARWPGRGRPDGLMRSFGPAPYDQHTWLPAPVNPDDLDDPRFTSTPLHWTRNDAMVRVLVEHGADVNARGTGGDLELPEWFLTPLWRAAHEGRIESVRLLVQAGADINILNPDGCNQALKTAAENGHPAVTDYLLAHGARADIISAALLGLEGEVARHLASDTTLAHHQDEHGRTPLDATTLMDAFRISWPQTEAHDRVARLLIAHGAQVDIAHAASLGAVEQVQERLQADPTAATRARTPAPRLTGATTFETALEVAERRGRTEVLRLLADAVAPGKNPSDNDVG